MKPFLTSVAEYFLSHYPDNDWSRLHFVFPNRRSCVFYTRDMQEAIRAGVERGEARRSIIGMSVETMGDLLARLTGLSKADNLVLACELYEAYLKVCEDGDSEEAVVPMSFEVFYSWAEILLHDFDDIDKSVVKAETLFKHIHDINEITDELDYITDEQRQAIVDFWNIVFMQKEDAYGNEKLVHERSSGDFATQFVRTGKLYKEFRSRLEEEGQAYSGMIYRRAVDMIRETGSLLPADIADGEVFIFIGFSVLTRSERVIMRSLMNSGRAMFFWDYTPRMEEEKNRKLSAGYAVVGAAEEFPSPKDFSCTVGDWGTKKINVVEVAYPSSQTTVIVDLLREIARKKNENNTTGLDEVVDMSDTALVLPEKSMLPGFLGAMPPEVPALNVTMGYGLRLSNISAFVNLLSMLWRSKYKRTLADGTRAFSAKVVLPILQHPATMAVCGERVVQSLIGRLTRENKAFVTREDVEGVEFLSDILDESKVADVVTYVTTVVRQVFDAYCDKKYDGHAMIDMTRSLVYEALKICRKSGEVMRRVVSVETSPDLLIRIMKVIIDGQQADLLGEPLMGLQVMGVLETRLLDFRNVIVPDFVEGKWPSESEEKTIIPAALRLNYGMPTAVDETSSFAYYFFRLVERAENVTLIVPAIADGKPNTQSRYIPQLELLYKLCDITKTVGSYEINLAQPTQITVNKWDFIERLERFMFTDEAGEDTPVISPSSLTTYLKCPLNFFLQKVMGIREADSIDEDVDDRVLGNIFHKTMEELYQDKPQLTEEYVRDLKADTGRIKDLLFKHLKEEMHINVGSEKDLNGSNTITLFALQKLVDKMIGIEHVGAEIVETEQEVSVSFPLSGQHQGKKIKLKGTIDRLHRKDGFLYVADYKTGSVKSDTIKELTDLFEPKKHDSLKAVMQVMVYCYILRNAGGEYSKETLKPVVFALRNGALLPKVNTGGRSTVEIALPSEELEKEEKFRDFEGQFGKQLGGVINEIFDLDVPFVQRADPKKCANCDFHHLCGF